MTWRTNQPTAISLLQCGMYGVTNTSYEYLLATFCLHFMRTFWDSSDCTCDMQALIVMPRPLSVSKEVIIIVLYYSVQSEVSAVRKLESPLVGSFFLY